MVPKISIIVPVYNCEKYISRCIRSIINQTYKNFECLIINDGSTDATEEVLKTLIKDDSRFKLYTEKNNGVSIARNIGLKNASGEWISFVDADDWIDFNTYEKVISITKDNVDLVIYGYSYNNGDSDYKTIIPNSGTFDISKDYLCQWQGPFSKLYKHEFIKNNSIEFPEKISIAEDLYFNFQFYKRTKKIQVISQSYYHYFQNENSAVHNFTEKKIQDEVLIIKTIENEIKTLNTTKWNKYLYVRKKSPKNRCLVNLNVARPDLWRSIFPEINIKMLFTSGFSRGVMYFLILLHLDSLVIKILKNRA